MFKFLKPASKSKSKIGGEIAYYGLTQWWLNAFTEDERIRVKEHFSPLGGSSNLTEGEISHSSQSGLGFLSNLAGWFGKKEDRRIAYKILEQAKQLVDDNSQPLDVHFLYQSMIELYYKDRESDGGLDRAINACRGQISVASQAASAFRQQFSDETLPSHKGYTQLAIIFEKQKKFKEAIELCELADKEGWAGDWQHRISRCEKRADKA